PTVLGAGEVRFSNKEIDSARDVSVLAPLSDGIVPLDWENATSVELPLQDLEQAAAEGAQFASLPGPAARARSYDKWGKDFAGWLYRSQRLELFKSPSLDQSSQPGESERDF